MTTQDNNPVANLMNDLGIGTDESTQSTNDTSNEENLSVNSDTPTNDGEKSETSDAGNTENSNTEVKDDYKAKLDELVLELEKAQKRISDKDKYINELRNSNKNESSREENNDDFWSNPEGTVDTLKKELTNIRNELAETRYANTKPDYWDYVNSNDVQEALTTDTEFSSKLQEASNPYEFAYNYFKAKKESIKATESASIEALKAKLREELLEEMKAGTKKETVPSIKNIGNSNSRFNDNIDDGFSAVFGGY